MLVLNALKSYVKADGREPDLPQRQGRFTPPISFFLNRLNTFLICILSEFSSTSTSDPEDPLRVGVRKDYARRRMPIGVCLRMRALLSG